MSFNPRISLVIVSFIELDKHVRMVSILLLYSIESELRGNPTRASFFSNYCSSSSEIDRIVHYGIIVRSAI